MEERFMAHSRAVVSTISQPRSDSKSQVTLLVGVKESDLFER
jgi:hypothetical protein